MKSITIASLLLMGGLSLAGCERAHKVTLSAEGEACKARIAALRSDVGLDGVRILYDSDKVGEQVLSLTNAQERLALFREFVEELYKIDIGRCTVREARRMIGTYCRIPEYLAYGLRRAGGSAEEAWQALVTGLEKYRRMCFSYGDENDMSDGWSREAGERRHVARWGRKSWKGCLLFCRDHSIKSVFGGAFKEVVEQYKVRLQKKFDMDDL